MGMPVAMPELVSCVRSTLRKGRHTALNQLPNKNRNLHSSEDPHHPRRSILRFPPAKPLVQPTLPRRHSSRPPPRNVIHMVVEVVHSPMRTAFILGL
jgi:hypothetical protein